VTKPSASVPRAAAGNSNRTRAFAAIARADSTGDNTINEVTIMTNDLTIARTDDGWSDAAAEANERTVRGTLLKFADWNWTRGKETEPVKRGTQFIAIGTAAAWVKWQGNKPVQTRLREPGMKMLEREELGDLDKGQWEVGPDNAPRDPWRNTRFVYLIDPHSAEALTFSTSSFGGREAVVNLGDAIARMRLAHPSALPIVALEAAPMITRYGRKSKPTFKIMGWKAADIAVPELLPPSEEPYEP
jgi:hypothetical protein